MSGSRSFYWCYPQLLEFFDGRMVAALTYSLSYGWLKKKVFIFSVTIWMHVFQN